MNGGIRENLMQALSDSAVAAWKRDGFLSPFPLLDEIERQECLAGLARFEAWLGGPVNSVAEMQWRTMPYFTLPWAARLARDPRILDRVEALIGPDILIYTSTFFIKEAGSETIAAWHQDSTYYGLTPADEVTVWVALTEASEAAGCMEALPFDNEPRQMRHQSQIVENSVNRANQRIVEAFDESRAVPMPLKAGEFSMHHGLSPHRSGANRAGHRRIGLGLNYIPTSVRSTGTARPAAVLVRGEDRYGHFDLMQPATAELSPDGIRAHEKAVGIYRANYVEQEARHAAGALA
jgi:non-heme Fe2+,alpha-ketoglutarate-dependent halogenase